MCAQLGAEVADAPSEATTHVVAARDRTDKVLWARQHARHAVSPLWLQSCGARARQLWPRLGGWHCGSLCLCCTVYDR